MEIEIGSNTFTNTSGVFQVDGKEQLKLEIGDDKQLLLSVDIYNEKGERIAKLNRNAWPYHDDKRYKVTTSPSSLTVSNTETGSVYFAAQVLDGTKIQVNPCKFYTDTGVPCEVTSSYLKIGGVTLQGNHANSGGGFINLTTKR
jgi:hypothetical protein